MTIHYGMSYYPTTPNGTELVLLYATNFYTISLKGGLGGGEAGRGTNTHNQPPTSHWTGMLDTPTSVMVTAASPQLPYNS